jgi:hypothetical protein
MLALTWTMVTLNLYADDDFIARSLSDRECSPSVAKSGAFRRRCSRIELDRW